VFQEERKEQKGGSGTSKRNLGKGQTALWCKRTTPKRSRNKQGRVDDKERGGNLCGVLRMQLQGYQNSGESWTRVPE